MSATAAETEDSELTSSWTVEAVPLMLEKESRVERAVEPAEADREAMMM